MVSELVDGADILYTRVLILVVVEDGLRDITFQPRVLIAQVS